MSSFNTVQSSVSVAYSDVADKILIVLILTMVMSCLNILFGSLQSAWDFPIISQRSLNPGSHIHNFLGLVDSPGNTQVFVCAHVLGIKLTLMLGMACSLASITEFGPQAGSYGTAFLQNHQSFITEWEFAFSQEPLENIYFRYVCKSTDYVKRLCYPFYYFIYFSDVDF